MHVTEFQILDSHIVIHSTNQHVHSWRFLPLYYRIYFLPRGVPRNALNSRVSSLDAEIAAEEMLLQPWQS